MKSKVLKTLRNKTHDLVKFSGSFVKKSFNIHRKKLRISFIVFLQISFLITTYGGAFLGMGVFNKVLALDTSQYPDCGGNTYNSEHICYIRGIYETLGGTDPVTGCALTNKIAYPNITYRFCDQANTLRLSNKEVIAFVNWHVGEWYTILDSGDPELAEHFNQPPNQPSIIRPLSLWELGPITNGSINHPETSCSTAGTGQGCTVTFRTRSFDPDFYQWIRVEGEVVRNQGGNRNYSANLFGNDQEHPSPQLLNDGHWNFRARNCDTTGECSGFTSYRQFIVDTTAPTGVFMNAEPEFTRGTQNTVSSTVGSDNIVGGINYRFQADDDPNFGSPHYDTNWIASNSYTFAGLNDDTKYYYRVKAKDRLNNEINWSTSVSSTQDNIPVELRNITIENERISPQNQDGQFDTSTINLEWKEKYPQDIKLEILNSNNQIVRTITDLITTTQEWNPHGFIWDGKDDGGNFVADGGYTMKISARDKAGNETIDDTIIVIIDNVPADINVSTPTDGSWFNYENININGQTEPDATAQITNNQTGTQTELDIDDNLGTFNHDDTVNLGANEFTFDVQDIAKNTSQKTIDYFREEEKPSINLLTPDTLINNRRPEITLNLSDTGFSDGTNDFISGIDVNSVYISLNHPDFGDEYILVNNGVITQGVVGNIVENCSTPGTFGNSGASTCTYKFVFTQDLTPDGNYTIKARVKDKAGNEADEKTQNFELDSNIYSDLTSPADGNLFNYSQITLTGTAEKNSEIIISLPFGDIDGDSQVDTETFVVSDSASNNSRVTVSNCRPSNSPTNDGIIEICDWEVQDFQLERDLVNPGNVTNQIKIDTKDNIDVYYPNGLNTKTQTITVNVDLYAVTLTIDNDTEYFSPNGDAIQDGVNFTNITTNGQIETYILEIKDTNGNVVKSFTAGGTPPNQIPWDGRDSNGNFVQDGTYSYQLIIVTTDGIEFKTTPVNIYAVTSLTDTVVITSPKTNTFSSRGVISVVGQAPLTLVNSTTSDLKIKICVDTVAIEGTCDREFETGIDVNGTFFRVVDLPRVNAQDEHYITATALDKYGNETEPSNVVKVTTTTNPPFESVEIIPILTGTNDPAAYQNIINKLDNGEEITEEDINALRSVIMRSTVYQGTERVRLFFYRSFSS